MIQIVPGVWQLAGTPRDMFNVYLVQDVLIDSGTRWAAARILSQLGRRRPRMVALTHCHPDHQGGAAMLCRRYRIPLACHAADVPAMEGTAAMQPENFIMRLGMRFWAGPTHPVGRVLHDGDEVAGFRVVHTPGHTPGHCLFFRDTDRVAIAGDVLANIHFLSGRPGLREPPSFFSVDRELNRKSIEVLAALKPRVICFGHGPPLTDPEKLEHFVARMQERAASRSGLPGRTLAPHSH
jgi:glyoxylase-like metal-dependent hydrolase (beta-lactamase superfamily II)